MHTLPAADVACDAVYFGDGGGGGADADAEQQADPCESSPCTDNSHSAALCKHREHGRTCSCQEPGFVYVNDHHGCVGE